MTSSPGMPPVTHRAVLAIAVPMTLAHLSTPLVGLVDMAVIGQLGDAAKLGGVALGAVLFDFLFWPFAFLRMGTAGLTAQALGARDEAEQGAVLSRAILIALCLGLVALILQVPLRVAGLWLLGGSEEVRAAAAVYFDVRIWAVPLTFVSYALLGWLIGMGRTGLGFGVELVLNLANAGLSAWFTLSLGMGIAGVAWGTVAAQAIAVVFGGLIVLRLRRGHGSVDRARLFDRAAHSRLLAVNRDIMIRSFLLLGALLFFARQGAMQGDAMVAANAVLMKLFSLASYFLDGFATAAEQLVGRALGARDKSGFARANRLALAWAASLSLAASLVALLAGPLLIDFLTTAEDVRATARTYLVWAALTPILGVAAFHFDGVYIGATWTRTMRDMMLLSFVLFIAVWAVAMPLLGNHGLWLALLTFLGARGVTLAWRLPHEMRRSFG